MKKISFKKTFIEEMHPGQEIDRLVAESMGWKWMRWHNMNYKSPDGPLSRILCQPNQWLDIDSNYVECDLNDPQQFSLSAKGPHDFYPSTSILDVWKMVSWANNVKHLLLSLNQQLDGSWYAEFHEGGCICGQSWAPTAELAICKAFLLTQTLLNSNKRIKTNS